MREEIQADMDDSRKTGDDIYIVRYISDQEGQLYIRRALGETPTFQIKEH